MKKDFVDAYINRGDVLIHLNRSNEALEQYRKATLHGPTNTMAFFNVSCSLMQHMQWSMQDVWILPIGLHFHCSACIFTFAFLSYSPTISASQPLIVYNYILCILPTHLSTILPLPAGYPSPSTWWEDRSSKVLQEDTGAGFHLQACHAQLGSAETREERTSRTGGGHSTVRGFVVVFFRNLIDCGQAEGYSSRNNDTPTCTVSL